MERTFNRRLIAGFGLLIGVLLANAGLAYYNTQFLHDNTFSVARSHEILAALDVFLSTTKDAEIGQQGYLVTGEEHYLHSYERALHDENDDLGAIERLTRDHPPRQGLARLHELIVAKQDQRAETVFVRTQRPTDRERRNAIINQDKALMDAIGIAVAEMKQEELDLLEQRERSNRRAYHGAVVSELVALVLGLLAVAAFFWVLRQHFKAQQAAAAVIHKQRELLDATLVSIGEGVIATDAAGHVTFLNPVAQQLTGWAPDEAQGQPLESVFRIVNEQTRTPVPNPALQALREGRTIGLENHTLLISRKREEWSIDDCAAPIRHGAGTVAGAVLVFRDVSERNRQENLLRQQTVALQEADRRKDAFLALLAHELRNPLAPVRNGLDVIKQLEKHDTTIGRVRDVMERQVRILTRLIDDLLEVARITHGKIQLRKEVVNLATVVRGAVETCEPALKERGHELTVSLPAEPLLLEADPVRVEQVLVNLLTNAAKYTAERGHVWLTAREEGHAVVLNVRDTGVGIPADLVPRIFEPFQQSDRSFQHAQGGLGLGLTLVRHLVEMHGGTVTATSAGLGQGSEFVVTLPCLPRQETQQRQRAEDSLVHAAASVPKRRILVVDDNVDAARSLAMLLQLDGHDVRKAHSGSAALALVQSDPPAIVFLDIQMPGMDGYEVARRLRELSGLGQVLLVALTGFGNDDFRSRSQDAGFDVHLVKPLDPACLKGVLSHPKLTTEEV